MRLHFDADTVKTLRAHAEASEPATLYGENTGKGLWLVGDQGVYLMSNGKERLLKPGTESSSVVAYAKECNPETLPFDTWWENKRRSFGGDDGVEFIDLKAIPASGKMYIDITPSKFAVVEILK